MSAEYDTIYITCHQFYNYILNKLSMYLPRFKFPKLTSIHVIYSGNNIFAHLVQNRKMWFLV
jgi:hypothetical protein